MMMVAVVMKIAVPVDAAFVVAAALKTSAPKQQPSVVDDVVGMAAMMAEAPVAAIITASAIATIAPRIAMI